MDANNKSQTPLRDDELTPEQLKKRNKNREKKERKRSADTNGTAASLATEQKAQQKLAPARVRLSDEEYTQQQIDKKSSKIERNPKGSVVSTAETSESRGLAFKIDEINAITEYTRANMGAEKVSFEDGATLLKFFKHNISDNVDKFIALAYSFDIGSRWALTEHKETLRQEKVKNAQVAAQRELSISSEIASETKEREAQEKVVEKAASELERAQEALIKAQETFSKAQETHTKTIAEQDAAFTERILSQKERRIAENKAKSEQNSEANKTQQSEAADTAGKEDNTNTQQV